MTNLRSALLTHARHFLGAPRHGGVSDTAMAEALRSAVDAWGEVTEWSIHPDALATLPDFVREAGLLIVECGSGFSTVVLHHWAQRRRFPTRLVSFEHQAQQLGRLKKVVPRLAVDGVHISSLSQITEGAFRRMLLSPSEIRGLWQKCADPLPEDLYGHTRITRAFYDGLVDNPPQLREGEQLLVVLDGPNGSGRSIAFPLLACTTDRESFWLVDDWDHYPFLEEMAQVFDVLDERTGRAGNKRWKLVRARPKQGTGTVRLL
jgi:hypothetical protein